MAHSYAQLSRSVNGLWARMMPVLHRMVYWCCVPSLFVLGKHLTLLMHHRTNKPCLGLCLKPRSPYLTALLEMMGLSEPMKP